MDINCNCRCLWGALCKLCTSQNLTLCFRLRCLRLCCRRTFCLFWVRSLIHRRQILGVVGGFRGWMMWVVPGMWSTTILSSFRGNFRFRRVTLPDLSTLTAYWSNCFTSITKPVRSHRSGWLPVWFWIKTWWPTLRGCNCIVCSVRRSTFDISSTHCFFYGPLCFYPGVVRSVRTRQNGDEVLYWSSKDDLRWGFAL